MYQRMSHTIIYLERFMIAHLLQNKIFNRDEKVQDLSGFPDSALAYMYDAYNMYSVFYLYLKFSFNGNLP